MLSYYFSDINQGFTLVELLTSIAILVILLGLISPMALDEFKNMESKTIATKIHSFLNNSKQLALVYQSPITLCVANDNYECVLTNGTQLISFIDKNDNHRIDSPTETTQQIQTLDNRFGEVAISVALNKSYIIMKPDSGRPIGYMGSIKYCPTDGDNKYKFKISFSKTGIIKLKKDSDEATNC
ncbi:MULTISPECIES: pilus assembly FimT family protein [unclassified Moraxella]|uniref:pilus assembly FimT family protein n=1 Tax=unclassified Moraxella TaxID=2685852 RepID=UPI003AF8FF1D